MHIDLIIIRHCMFIYYITFAAAFLSTMIREKTTDLWIGFSNLASGRFKWTDGSTVTFTDWAKGEPQTHVWTFLSV